MTASKKYSKKCEGKSGTDGSGPSQDRNNELKCFDPDISHKTKLQSTPHQLFYPQLLGKSRLPVSTLKMLAGRECNVSGRGRFSSADSCHVLSRYLPVNVNGPVNVEDQLKSRAYISQFSVDGSLFIAGFQGSIIRIYDVDNGWKVKKEILAKSLRWTITDTTLSPDEQYLAYTSLSPIVHIVKLRSDCKQSIANITEIHDGLDFSHEDDGNDEFPIFSVKFSRDGEELVAGSGDESIYVYNLEANKVVLRIPAHESDVNTVCFADDGGHLIYSGSDDTLCKVWDRRCLRTREKSAGVLTGHIEGVTFIDSRGDGRYFISNGKDQTIKLWDIRKMSSNANLRLKARKDNWDYRWMDYLPRKGISKLPDDLSLLTYRGHSVLQTLIRCYFSPLYSTGQKYIYTGSSDHCVYIYDLVSGAQVAKLKHHQAPVRDCSWHPYYPMLISSSWDCLLSKWEFPGIDKKPTPVRRKKRKEVHFLREETAGQASLQSTKLPGS